MKRTIFCHSHMAHCRISWPSHVRPSIRVRSRNLDPYPCVKFQQTLSLLIGPPVGGALFDRFGILGPCLFGVVMVSIDLYGRLLVIERREALAWGFDPVAKIDAHAPNSASYAGSQYGSFNPESDDRGHQTSHVSVPGEAHSTDSLLDREADRHGAPTFHDHHDPISLFQVISGLCMSSRAVAAVFNGFVYG